MRRGVLDASEMDLSQGGGLLGRERLKRPALGGDEQERAADADLMDNVDTLGKGRVWAGVVPNGAHGRLVHKGGMSDGNADEALNRLAGVALELSKAAWKARCTWSNGIEINAQTRNRWKEAFAIVASKRSLGMPRRRRLYALNGP